MIIYNIENLQKCQVIKRPSSKCKTPYVADIKLLNNELTLAHTPSLGCCGLCEKDCFVMVRENETKKKCTHSVILSCVKDGNKEIYVGIYPKLAENIVNKALTLNCFSELQNIKKLEPEKKFLNSRFDFYGINEKDEEFILEVKNVPLSNYFENIYKNYKEIYDSNKDNYPIDKKIAYFPDGYRKKKGDVVSPRALKHVQELEEISKNKKIKTYLCFVIQREDAEMFQISLLDPKYRNAVQSALQNGVKILTLQIKWNQNGEVEFMRDNLEIDI